MTHQHCTVCASDRTAVIHPRADLPYVRCHACGHCVLINASGDAHQSFEAAQHKYYSESSILLSTDLNLFDSETLRDRQVVLGKYLRQASRVLEIGPGAGHVIQWLQQQGHVVKAIEESPTLASQLAARFPGTILTGAFESLDIAPASYDAFCSFHVIEHVSDPLAHLQKALRAVKPGGLAFIATPNAHSWQQLAFQSLSPNFDSAHLFVFSKASLRMLAERAGWKLIACHTPDVTSGWARVLTKALRRLKKQDEEATAGQYAQSSSRALTIAMRILQAGTGPLRFVQAKLGYGNEVFLVLQKPGDASTLGER